MRINPWAAFGIILTIFGAQPASAVTYRNPAHDVAPGRMSFGLGLEDQERTFDVERSGESDRGFSLFGLSFGYGLVPGVALDATLNSVSISGETLGRDQTGLEAGLLLRWNLDADTPLNPDGDTFSQFRKGVLAGIRLGDAEDEGGLGTGYVQYDLGFGVGTPLIRQVQLYAGGVLSLFEGTGKGGTIPDYDVYGASMLGAFAGVEYQAQPNLLVGAELHLIHEWGFAIYAQYSP